MRRSYTDSAIYGNYYTRIFVLLLVFLSDVPSASADIRFKQEGLQLGYGNINSSIGLPPKQPEGGRRRRYGYCNAGQKEGVVEGTPQVRRSQAETVGEMGVGDQGLVAEGQALARDV